MKKKVIETLVSAMMLATVLAGCGAATAAPAAPAAAAPSDPGKMLSQAEIDALIASMGN